LALTAKHTNNAREFHKSEQGLKSIRDISHGNTENILLKKKSHQQVSHSPIVANPPTLLV
jgi:hypothetical protein